MGSVTSALREHKNKGQPVSLQYFKEFLRNASKRSKMQIELANARNMLTESYRDFNSRIKNLVRMGFANADEATLEKIAIKEFKLKVPNLVR